MSKRSETLRAADAKIDRDKLYAPLEAVRLAKETSASKFDGTVEVAFRSWALTRARPTRWSVAP